MREDSETSSVLDLVGRFVRGARLRYPIAEAYLFGSWACGDPSPESDIDIGLVLENGVPEDAASRLFMEGLGLDPRIEVHTYPRARFERERRQIFAEIREKGIKIA